MDRSGAFTAAGTVSAIKAAATYLVFMLLLAILLYQSPHLASALTGGASIRTGGAVAAGYAMSRVIGGRVAAAAGRGRGRRRAAAIAAVPARYAAGRRRPPPPAARPPERQELPRAEPQSTPPSPPINASPVAAIGRSLIALNNLKRKP